MTDHWHVHPGTLDDYLTGRLDPARVLSVEAHVARCARCRGAIPADQAWLDDGWAEILDAVDRPRLSPVERLLRLVGVPEHRARLLAATPSLRRSWLLSLAAVLGFAVLASQATGDGNGHTLVFLVVAPVLPVLAVAAAYGPRVDPVHEIAATTPSAGAKLLLWRSSAVLVASVVTCAVGAALLHDAGWLAAAWLLPALALCLTGLALATAVPLQLAAGVLGGSWVIAVITVVNVTRDQGTAFGPVAQVGYVVAAALAALTLFARRRRLDPGEP
jgi:hypothetical protein